MGHAGNARRRTDDARPDRRRALARGVADGRRRALVAPRRGGPLDAAPPRRGVQGARDARTGWSGTCRRSGRCSTRNAGSSSSERRTRCSRGLPFVEDGLANWAYIERPELPSAAGEIRLQWCAGAPGIVVAAADYLDEELLLAGAELVWKAGPPTLEKGAGICHGTAGNGYALLAAFGRTGDEEWLERARAFAAHALGQVERAEGRYALWTGGVGAAVFAADCLEGKTRYPVLG